MNDYFRITGLQTLEFDGLPAITLHFSIDDREHSIEMSFQDNSKTADALIDDFTNHRFPLIDWQFVGHNNKGYIACKCLFYSMERTGLSMTTLSGQYHRLIEGFEEKQAYSNVCFSFKGIENLIKPDAFKMHFEKSESLSIARINFPSRKKQSTKINENIEMTLSINQKYELNKWDRFHLDQEPSISFSFKHKQNINQIITFLLRVRYYLEFMYQRKKPLSLERVVLIGDDNSSIEILYDCTLSVSNSSEKDEEASTIPADCLFSGLNGWLKEYKKYEQAIMIWRKTVTNSNINENDRALWFAQAFESIVLTNKELLLESISCIPENSKRREEKKPNIKEMLCCLDDRHCFYDCISKTRNQFFSTVKDYRNELVHCNPEKRLTMGQILNSRRIIQTAFFQAMKLVMNLNWVPQPTMLIHSEKDDDLYDEDKRNHMFDYPAEELSE